MTPLEKAARAVTDYRLSLTSDGVWIIRDRKHSVVGEFSDLRDAQERLHTLNALAVLDAIREPGYETTIAGLANFNQRQDPLLSLSTAFTAMIDTIKEG